MAKKKPARKSAKKTAKSARPKAAARKGAKKTAKKGARKTAGAKRPAMKKAGARKGTAKKSAAKKTMKKSAAKRPPTKKSSGMRTAAKSTAKRPAAKRTAPKKQTGAARQLGHTVGEAIAKMAGKVKSAITHESKPARRPVASKPASTIETPAARTVTPSTGGASSAPAAPAPLMPSVGDPAPGFELRDAQGNTHKLSQYAGKRVVLYFYPKDDTPGCTTEACGFRNVHGEFDSAEAVLLGVSPDSADSHARFAAKYGLPYTLLSDEDHQVAERYGVWREKQNYGKTYMGIARTTFIIDENGRIARIFQNVSPQGHEGQVLAWLREHQPLGASAGTSGSPQSGEGGSLFSGI